MKDPIEGEYRVIGEQAPREPIIKSWENLGVFLLILAVVTGLKTYQVLSENALWERTRDADRHTSAEQAATGGAAQEGAEDLRIG